MLTFGRIAAKTALDLNKPFVGAVLLLPRRLIKGIRRKRISLSSEDLLFKKTDWFFEGLFAREGPDSMPGVLTSDRLADDLYRPSGIRRSAVRR